MESVHFSQISRRMLPLMVALSSLASAVISLPGLAADQPFSAELLAQAAAPDTVAEIDELSRQTALKCVALERYNLLYRKSIAVQGKWKSRRYFLGTEASNLVSLAGFITGTYERGKNIDLKKSEEYKTKNKRNVLENGNILGIIGQTIGASASATELTINVYHEVLARRAGYSPPAAHAKVLALRAEIDTLLAQRQRLIDVLNGSPANSGFVAVAVGEQKVLTDIRNMALGEFVQFHRGARRLLATQNTLYTIDMARNSLGAVGNHFGWKALATGNRHNNLTAGIFFLTSGFLTTVNPIASRLVGREVGIYEAKRMSDVVAGTVATTSATLATDVAALKAYAAAAPYNEQPLLRDALYERHAKTMDEQYARSRREVQSAARSAAENVFAGVLVGGTKIAGGTVFTIAGAQYRRSSRLTNSFLFVNNVLGDVGAGFASIDNARLQVMREYQTHKLAKQGLLPGQILNTRLKQLDSIEASLNQTLPIRTGSLRQLRSPALAVAQITQ